MKTVFIGLNWLGDIVMSLPAIKAAAEHSEVHVVTRPHLADVYKLLKQPVNIHAIETRSGFIKLAAALEPVQKLMAEHCIVLPDSLRAAIVARLCHCQKITGYKGQWRSALLSNRMEKPENFRQIHESELHLALVKKIFPEIAGISMPELATADHEEWLMQVMGTSRPFFVFAPGAAFGAAKRWPPERFAQLADLIHQEFAGPILLTGSEKEQPIMQEICKQSSAELIDLSGKTDFSQLIYLLQRGKALIANDSGTMHLGALTQIPTVVPVGPTDMVRTGPLNKNSRIVSNDACPLAPCRKKVCPRLDHLCMVNISAEEVMMNLKYVLDGQNAS